MTHINNNFDDSFLNHFFLDYNEDRYFIDWCNLEGSEKISELSRQLRSYLNYKCNIIRLRYSEMNRSVSAPKRTPVLKLEGDLSSLFTRLVMLMNSIVIEDKTISEKLKILLKNVVEKPNDFFINLLKEIKNLSTDIWKRLHLLSEFELHYHPKLINVLIRIGEVMCSIQGVFFYPYFDFYQELKKNYEQLERELSNLLQMDKVSHSNKKDTNLKVKITK